LPVDAAAHPKADAARIAGIMVLADDDPRWKWDPVEQARAACEGGAGCVQLRAKHAPDREALAWARAIREATRASGVLFVVNDRFDLAWLAGADGVHLGQDDLPPRALPAAARDALLVGRSTHEPSQLEAARGEPVDYVAFGPVFGTKSKASPYDARGEDALARAVRAAAPRPLVAIGGIGAANLAVVAAAGAAAAAVISAVAGADDPRAATRALVDAFEGGRKR
jgi:thiamine-phosphate pyrophosphorylase